MERFCEFTKIFLRSRDGGNMVEFALVAPFLVLLTLGIIDFGRVMWVSTTMEHLARETSRYASLHGDGSVTVATEDSTKVYASDHATGLDLDDLTVAVSWAGGSNAPGSSVTVQLNYDFDLFLSGILGFAPLQLDSASTMTIL